MRNRNRVFETARVVLEINLAINAYATNYRRRVNSMKFSITSKYFNREMTMLEIAAFYEVDTYS